MKRSLVSLALLAWLGAAGAAPPPFNPSTKPEKLAADFLKPNRLTALNGIDRVAIANFRVEFAVENSGANTSSSTPSVWNSSSSSLWSSSKFAIKLVGIEDAVRASIASQLYEQFVKQLNAAGVDLVPHATVRKSEAYRALGPVLKSAPQTVATQLGKSVFAGPQGMPFYFTADDKHVGVTTALSGFGMVKPREHEARLAEALNAAVLRVTLAIAFVQLKSETSVWTGESGKVTVNLGFVPQLTQVTFVTPADATARIALSEPAVLPDELLELRYLTTETERVAETVGSIISGGYSNLTKERRYEAVAEPEPYSAAITAYGSALETAVVSLMRKAFQADADH